jgi:putative RecB family exonuclease
MTIQELRNQPHLSVSAINDYLECSLSYKFGRVDGIAPEYTADAQLFGSCIHKALEAFHLAKMNGHKISLEDLIQRFSTPWHELTHHTPNLRFKAGESKETLLQSGKEILTAYYRELPPDHFQVLGTELPFSFPIDGLPVPLIGVMDWVEKDDGGNIIITDFKTSSHAYSLDEIDRSLQLTVYYLAARNHGFANQEILLRFDCLIKTKKPKFEQYYTIRTEVDERRTVKKIKQVWESIQKGIFIPHDTSWKCGYCAYKQHCDEWFQK